MGRLITLSTEARCEGDQGAWPITSDIGRVRDRGIALAAFVRLTKRILELPISTVGREAGLRALMFTPPTMPIAARGGASGGY
jgi:hypothetical protein